MRLTRMITRPLGFLFRTVVLPGFVAATMFGVTTGGHGTIAMTPAPRIVLHELAVNHNLPSGTTLSIGDPSRPIVVTYDATAGVTLKPPRGESFGHSLGRGVGEMTKVLGIAPDAAHATPSAPAASTHRP